MGERDPEVVSEWLVEESSTPVDLTAGRLLRARLLAVDGQEHVLLINHHHIASEGRDQPAVNLMMPALTPTLPM